MAFTQIGGPLTECRLLHPKGDTVNTASRMESNGQRGKIQVSQATADLVMEAGKESWLTPRTEKVAAKGKGMLQTYWLDPSKGQRGSSSGGPGSDSDFVPSESNDPLDRAQKNTRLIEWMVELLMEDVKKIVSTDRGELCFASGCLLRMELNLFYDFVGQHSSSERIERSIN